MRSLILLGIVTYGFANCHADEAVSSEQALKIIESIERRIESWQCRIYYSWGTYDSLSNPRYFTPTDPKIGLIKNGIVVYEPWTGRYRFEYQATTTWQQGQSPFLSEKKVFTYNGETEQRLSWSKPGTEMPGPTDIHTGEIRPDKSQDFILTAEGQFAGIGWFPPLFMQKRLSELLREANGNTSLIIKQNKNGVWQIDATLSYRGKKPKVRFDYNPHRGGAITDATFFMDDGIKPWQRCKFELQEIKSDLAVPKILDILMLPEEINKEKKGVRITYTDLKVNEKIENSVFNIEFPPGTRVVDYQSRKSYVTGDVESERSAIQRFVKEESIYIAAHPENRLWWIIGSSLGVVLLILSLWLFRRKVAQKIVKTTKLLITIGVSLTFISTSFGQHYELDSKGNWLLRDKHGFTRFISQCGLNVTILALETFKINYDLRTVSAGMPPKEGGISLADIHGMLEAFGLQSDLRKGVTAEDIITVVRGGRLAIVPINIDPIDKHYVVLHARTDNNIVLLDPPHGSKVIDKAELEKQISGNDGAILFVSSLNRVLQPQANSLKITPEFIELGAFTLSDSESHILLQKKIQITNTGSRTVLVRQVFTACACTSSKWQGGLIRPNQTKEIDVEVLRSAWGAGAIERPVTFVMSDNSVKLVKFRGTGVLADAAHGLEISPDLLRIEVDPEGKQESVINRIISVIIGRKSDPLDVSSDVTWLRHAFGKEMEGVTPLKVEIRVDPRLFENNEQVEGNLALMTRKDVKPAIIRVVLRQKLRYRSTQAVTVISRGVKQQSKIVLLPVSDASNSNDDIVAVCEPQGLDVKISKHKEGYLSALTDSKEDAKAGY